MIYLILFGIVLVLVFGVAVAAESDKQKAAKQRSGSISKR
ncbi:hypothetical protein SAMN05192580_3625 [Sphingomonas jatrophae]|uniref:Uncharacterized protein n=1 Tax=Sphingomonas jatrophae TaxID=1166337 RepID=A0A1I6M7K7_9SPHN|nr:hypothetical protein SAMN05192580_3625 [Sphingomonas jatrophae]